MPTVRSFALPDLGEGLTSAEIVRWLVAVGDHVTVDQPVVEVETAKAVVEVPCPYAGVVTTLAAEAGAELPVGAPLITVAVATSAEDQPAGAPTADQGSGNVLVGYGTSGHSTTRRRRVTQAPAVAPVVPATAVAVISPLVRRLAKEHDIDLRSLTGSGPDGLILRADVQRAITAAPAAGGTEGDVLPLRGGAKLAAEKFSRSRREIPDVTVWVDADATELLAAKAASGLPLLALLARVCVAALKKYPQLNSSVVTDAEGRATGVRQHASIGLGFAAQTPQGLVVPVVREAQSLTTEQLAAELGRLTTAAREGSLSPADLTGGTFTLNNYGVFGVDGSTPIINHPETAMVGVGRITPKPWVLPGTMDLTVRQVTQLSFTFDHRVCDGAVAAGFLRLVADAVESPATLLRYL